MARTFKVFYARDLRWAPFDNLTRDSLSETHVYLKEVEAETPDDVFFKMQGEIWSPHGEARELIRSKGLWHTSMSVGDVMYDAEADSYLQVMPFGFQEIP